MEESLFSIFLHFEEGHDCFLKSLETERVSDRGNVKTSRQAYIGT